jgi:hypothetical protein
MQGHQAASVTPQIYVMAQQVQSEQTDNCSYPLAQGRGYGATRHCYQSRHRSWIDK